MERRATNSVGTCTLVMGHMTHYKQMDPQRLYQVYPSNVDADTCKVFPYVMDMSAIEVC